MEDTAAKPKGHDTDRAAARLRRTLEAHSGERHAVAIRGYPDPDSIGSAMAHARICRQFGIEATTVYFDDISHHENRALVKKLNIEMVRYTPGIDLGGMKGIALVDTQKIELPDELKHLPLISIVDHHRPQPDVEAEFRDVREDAGSTAAIYAEYLSDGIAPFVREEENDARIATAMLYGIRTDTDNFLLARDIDFRGAAFLAPLADRDLLTAISTQKISVRAMEIIHRAFANKVIVDTFLISGVEFVREEDRDSIGQAADYLLRREGIDTVICYGIVGNQFVDGSLRTTSHVVDPDGFIKHLLGTDRHGAPYGGGRADKGAFKVPLGPFAHCGDRELLWRMVRRTLEDLFFEKIGINRNT